MKQIIVNTSEARKKLPALMERINERGDVVVITIHSKPKIAMIDMELFEQYVDNLAFGVTEEKLLKSSKEKKFPVEKLIKELNV